MGWPRICDECWDKLGKGKEHFSACTSMLCGDDDADIIANHYFLLLFSQFLFLVLRVM
jgi:hypothetical protein